VTGANGVLQGRCFGGCRKIWNTSRRVSGVHCEFDGEKGGGTRHMMVECRRKDQVRSRVVWGLANGMLRLLKLKD